MTGDNLLELAGGFCEASLLHHAVSWGLFERTRSFHSVSEIADNLGLLTHKLEPVLDALTALGFLERQAGRYRNSSLTETHLVEGAPDDLRAYVLYMKVQWKSWQNLDPVLKAREPLEGQQDPETFGERELYEFLLDIKSH